MPDLSWMPLYRRVACEEVDYLQPPTITSTTTHTRPLVLLLCLQARCSRFTGYWCASCSRCESPWVFAVQPPGLPFRASCAGAQSLMQGAIGSKLSLYSSHLETTSLIAFPNISVLCWSIPAPVPLLVDCLYSSPLFVAMPVSSTSDSCRTM